MSPGPLWPEPSPRGVRSGPPSRAAVRAQRTVFCRFSGLKAICRVFRMIPVDRRLTWRPFSGALGCRRPPEGRARNRCDRYDIVYRYHSDVRRGKILCERIRAAPAIPDSRRRPKVFRHEPGLRGGLYKRMALRLVFGNSVDRGVWVRMTHARGGCALSVSPRRAGGRGEGRILFGRCRD